MDDLSLELYQACTVATSSEKTVEALKFLEKHLPEKLRELSSQSRFQKEPSFDFKQLNSILKRLHGKLSEAIFDENIGKKYESVFADLVPVFKSIFQMLSELFEFTTEKSLSFKRNQCSDFEDLNDIEKVQLEFFSPYFALQQGNSWQSTLKEISAELHRKQGVGESLWKLNIEKLLFNSIPIRVLSLALFLCRDLLIKKFSFSVPTQEVIELVVKQKYKLVLEIGCGKGYWTYLLREAGVNIVAQDLYIAEGNKDTNGSSPFVDDIFVGPLCKTEIERILKEGFARANNDGIEFKERRAVLFCWIPKMVDTCNEFLKILSFFSNSASAEGEVDLIIVGDSRLCGSQSFWKEINSNYTIKFKTHLPRFIGYFDTFQIYTKNK